MADADDDDDEDDDDIEYGYFDADGDVYVRHRNLPHWFQPGAATFVTFRTADSLPREVHLRMQRELELWLKAHNLPVGIAKSNAFGKVANWDKLWQVLSKAQTKEYNKIRHRLFHSALDECHGQCLLKKTEVAEIVAESILHGNGSSYDVDRFVIMPNHVHVLAQFYKNAEKIIGQSWMRYTARKINAKLGRRGSFWQSEPFDHIIRSADQFAYLRSYVENNPMKAKLRDGEFYYWSQL